MATNEISINKKPKAKGKKFIDAKFSCTNSGIPIKKLYVSNLPHKVIKDELYDIFSWYGEVRLNYPKKKSGYMFITFTDENNALKVTKAANKKKIIYRGKLLNVVPAYEHNQPDIDTSKKKMSTMKLRSKKRPKNSAEDDSDKASSSLPTINILDNDCLIKIFLYLPIIDRIRIERVCKRWQTVNLQSWNDIKELKFPGSINSLQPYTLGMDVYERAVVKLISRCGRFLNMLTYGSYGPSGTFETIPTIAKHCYNLQYLNLYLDNYPNKDMTSLFYNLRKLERLELSGLDRKFMDACLKKLPTDSMKELRLITGESLFDSASCFTHMTRAGATGIQALKNLWKLELNGFTFKADKLKLISLNESITHLSLENSCFKKCINVIANFRGLKYLDVSNVDDLNDDCLTKLAANCTELEELHMDNCPGISDIGISALIVLKKLHTLMINEIYVVSDADLSKFITLKVLHCERCDSVCDNGIIQLIQNAPHLEEINLCGTSVSSRVLDAAFDVAVSRANSIPLKVFVSSTVELKWDKPSDILPPLLTVEGQEESMWEPYWNDPETSSYDGYDDFDEGEDFDEDSDGWGLYDFDEDFVAIVGDLDFI